MGLGLIAASDVSLIVASGGSEWFTWATGVFMAAAGLGFIIFVHELGHFAVARMCGVKCEKFMVGFDFGGLRIGKQWGETFYGIGVFPLGGYVKMLGQDDDPSKAAEQLEASKVAEDSEFAKEVTGPDGKTRTVDRRSYQAKSVPQRMAIISAGVIMNVIFAFVLAFVAFGIGVDYMPCEISQTVPGGPAWTAGLTTGDEIIKINDRTDPGYDHLRSGVSLGDLEAGVPLEVRRAGADQVEAITLKPEKSGGLAKIGVLMPYAATLHPAAPTRAGSPAAETSPALQGGDRVVAVNGEPVADHREIMAALIAGAAEPIDLRVAREADGESASAEEITVSIAPEPAKRLGLVVTMGPLARVQKGSPAADAGLKAGDQIVAFNGQPFGAAASGEPSLDPAMLESLLAAADGPVTLGVVRKGGSEPELITVTPRTADWPEGALFPGVPMSAPSIGVAYELLPTVAAVVEGGQADQAGFQVGDTIKSATLRMPGSDEEANTPKDEEVALGDDAKNWPHLLEAISRAPAGLEVQLAIKRGDDSLELKLTPAAGSTFVADRGLQFGPLLRKREVASLSDQAYHAWDQTWFSLTTVVRFLNKLVSAQVPANQLGGPLTILSASYQTAVAGWSPFLLFLVMLSANLAVLNFLPIPVLDGGHMVFLAWEGLTGKPANDRVAVALQLVGFAMLLSLMVYVTRNDILNLFFR